MEPTPERFAALARSSPWRWRTARFEVRWTGPRAQPPVRAWLRRPGALRVETLDGELLLAGVTGPQPVPVMLTDDGRQHPAPMTASGPLLGDDGLVRRRPRDWQVGDDPMYQDYRWVAMLDPVELADGEGRHTEHPEPCPVEVSELRAVEHAGRPAWEAVLRPTASYDPRCSCCPLLHSAASAAREVEAGLPADPDLRYADAHLVRLDVGTGVCVLTEEVGGPDDGAGHRLVLLGVDEDLPEDLFVPPPQGRLRRRRPAT